MKNKAANCLSFLVILLFVPAADSQDNAQAAKSDQQGTAPPTTDTQKKNVQEYIELLRSISPELSKLTVGLAIREDIVSGLTTGVRRIIN